MLLNVLELCLDVLQTDHLLALATHLAEFLSGTLAAPPKLL